MKNLLTVVALLSIPAAGLLAADKPCGILGVDSVAVYGTYYNDDYSHYHEADYNSKSVGVILNKNVLDAPKYGVDVRAQYYFVTNVSGRELYDVDQNSGKVSGVVFLKGVVSPYFAGSVYFHHHSVDYKDATPDLSSDGWALDAEGGLEFHLLPGFSGNVYVSENHSCDDSYPKNITRYGASLMYWFTDKVGVSVGEVYESYDHIDSYATTVSMRYHF
jgi:hypothetical protein